MIRHTETRCLINIFFIANVLDNKLCFFLVKPAADIKERNFSNEKNSFFICLILRKIRPKAAILNIFSDNIPPPLLLFLDVVFLRRKY